MDEARYKALCEKLRTLSPSRFLLIERTVERFGEGMQTYLAPNSPPFTDLWVDAFGDTLQTHHSLSVQNLGKDRFEFALLEAFEQSGIAAVPHKSKTHPGFDVEVLGEKWSLKTQGDLGIKKDEIHISKFMELGKGKWDIDAQRQNWLHHMENYERIFTLRHWEEMDIKGKQHFYELVEIPKSLLLEAQDAPIREVEKTKQETKPAYISVYDENNMCKFELYFDAGSERKLQVKHIRKKYCKVIASWKFKA